MGSFTYVGQSDLLLSRLALDYLRVRDNLIIEVGSDPHAGKPLADEILNTSCCFIVGGDPHAGRYLYVFPDKIEDRLVFAAKHHLVIESWALHFKKLVSIRVPQDCDGYCGAEWLGFCAALDRLHAELTAPPRRKRRRSRSRGNRALRNLIERMSREQNEQAL